MADTNTTLPVGDARPSLINSLEKRYKSERAGGAFDAKKITTKGRSFNGGVDMGIKEKLYTEAGFQTSAITGASEFKYVKGEGKNAIPESIKNLSTKKYKP